MIVLYRVRIGKKGVVYLPADVRKKLGIIEGGELVLIVKKDAIILKPLKTIFKLGAESRKICEITVEEFEKESVDMQVELYGG